jgi:hypothetical protein
MCYLETVKRAMPVISLTARKVRSLKVPTEAVQVDHWDRSLPGFALRVSAAGRKSWVVMYRHNGRLRRMTLGTYPALGLAEARERARRSLGTAQDGHDPASGKIAARHAKTFRELTEEYIQRHAKVHKKTWREDQRNIDKDLLPRWRNVTPAEITRADVRAMVESIAHRRAPIRGKSCKEDPCNAETSSPVWA